MPCADIRESIEESAAADEREIDMLVDRARKVISGGYRMEIV